MSPHSDTLFYFRSNHYLFLLFNDVCLATSKYKFTVIDLLLSGKNQQIPIYSYWFTPQRKKPANTDLQLLVCPLEKKTSKYRFTVIDLPLSEKKQRIQIYSYWFAPQRKKTSKYRFTVIDLPLSEKKTDLQLLVCSLAENQEIQTYIYWFAPQRKTSKHELLSCGELCILYVPHYHHTSPPVSTDWEYCPYFYVPKFYCVRKFVLVQELRTLSNRLVVSLSF